MVQLSRVYTKPLLRWIATVILLNTISFTELQKQTSQYLKTIKFKASPGW